MRQGELYYYSHINYTGANEVICIDTIKLLESMKSDGVVIDRSCLHGDYRELYDLVGYEAVEKIYMKYYGGYLSLPKKLLADEFVHSYISACYCKGRNAKEMAREFDYTYSWIMKVVKKVRENEYL